MGASLKDIKRQSVAVEKTRQITRAMNMVAASKLKSAQLKMENFRSYADKLRVVFGSLASRAESTTNPLLAVREPRRIRVIMMTSDRGLCGGFNTNIIKEVTNFTKEKTAEGQEVSLIAVGKKGRDSFRKKGNIVSEHIEELGSFDMSLAAEIAEEAVPSFVAEEYDELYLCYNEFRNIASQKPVMIRLLPASTVGSGEAEPESTIEYIYEPSEEQLLAHIIPMYLRVLIYRGLLETSAGEHGARMVAMDNATSNCEEMIQSLTQQFNRARQAAITAELMDIVGGTEALAAQK
ncbi:MAG: ATP synthase F1 subunit gamma [Thermodesulfobacteriota bacterium]|nr:ATP synthase F1 subunit gamma [Thermodesulfobacteriota bacterium]